MVADLPGKTWLELGCKGERRGRGHNIPRSPLPYE
jgi:hypothetical protein